MSDSFPFGVFPYVAVRPSVVGVGGRAFAPRARRSPRGRRSSSRSGAVLGSVPWHYAILASSPRILALRPPRAVGRAPRRPVAARAILEVAGLALGVWAMVAILPSSCGGAAARGSGS